MSIARSIDMPGLAIKSGRIVSSSDHPEVLTDIYNEQTNMVIWKRKLPTELLANIRTCLEHCLPLNISEQIDVNTIVTNIRHTLEPFGFAEELTENIVELVDMFCCLFDLKQAGLRLKTLDRAMCPRFHVDRVPCRLVTTFCGTGTQWLSHDLVNRNKLGTGNNGLPDEASGLYPDSSCIQTLNNGDVALLKGELWEGNQNAGLVHRSPSLQANEKRLLLTLDIVS